MKLLYTGSVKNVYQDPDPSQLWFEFTDDYSVFDWGKMPDTIPGKGQALATLAGWFFDQLSNAGRWKALGLEAQAQAGGVLPCRHHYARTQGNRIQVRKVQVPHLGTRQVGGVLVYDYTFAPEPTQLIPLEVIFRFGAPKGSSILKRKDWYPFDIHEGVEFEKPLIEFSTKLESKDRMLTYQEAALVLKGDTARLARVHDATLAVALFLQRTFAQKGLKLWDGKVEWAWIDGQLALVDSIGPDELRVSLGDAVFSKQFLRDYYVGGAWLEAVEKAKTLAHQRGTADWKTICAGELKQTPPPLSANYLEAASALYADFQALVTQDPGAVNPGAPAPGAQWAKTTRFVDALKNLK